MTRDQKIAALLEELAEQFRAEAPAMPEPEDVLLTVEEAARHAKMSRAWLYRNAPRLPFTVRMGRSVRMSKQGLETWLRERKAATARGPHVA